MAKYTKKEDDPEQSIRHIRSKLNMLNLTHEVNRLQFAIMAYSSIHEKELKNNITIYKAAEIVLSFLPTCLKYSRQYLTNSELETLFGFMSTCLFDYFKPSTFKKLK